MNYAIVFLGAGIGGMMRHALSGAGSRLLGASFPASTLVVNVVGSVLMGVLAGYFAARTGLPQHLRLFLATGILGGFTTFSAFSFEAAILIQRQQYGLAGTYVAASLFLAIAGFFAGLALIGGTRLS